jgi:PAS domain S-box-containing protein
MNGDVLVCGGSDRRAAAATLSAAGFAVRTAAEPGEGVDVDCVVGVDVGEALATRLEGLPVPAVLFGGEAATALPVADGPEELVARVRESVRVAADGGARPERVTAPIERMTDGFLELDTDWEVTYLNGAGEEVLGVDAEAVVGRSLWAALPGLEGTDLGAAFRTASETGEAQTVEAYHGPVDARLELRVYPDADGLSALFRDVTERTRTRQELAASEASVQRLHETVSDPSLSADEKLREILALGRERLGTDIALLSAIEGDTWRAVEAVSDDERLQAGMEMPVEDSYCRKLAGEEEPLAVLDAAEAGWEGDPAYERWELACYLGAPVRVDGELFGAVCFADTDPRDRDFSPGEVAFVELLADWTRSVLERESYESELREQRRRLELVTDNVPVVLFALDPDGTYTLTRGRGLDALGFESGEAVGESVFELYADYPGVLANVERALAGEETHHTVELDSGVVLEVWYQPVIEDGEVTQVVGVTRDITDSEHRREQLERERAFVEGLLDSLPDPIYAFDDGGRLVRWNEQLERVTGYDPGALDGMTPLELVAEPDHERLTDALARVREGEQVSIEVDLETSVGDYLAYEVSGAPMYQDGEVAGVAGVARHIGELRSQREMLSGLLETTRSLMQARDREEVADIAATAARDVLGFDIGIVRLYDAESGELRPAAQTDGATEQMGERPVYEVGEGGPGEVFATGEPKIVDNTGAVADPGEVRSVLYHPMGVHGTISIGSTAPDAFEETDRQTLALLATAAAAACTRAKREREVREAREHTETVLERVNGLIENTIEVLVQATTREELESGVVSELAATEPYSFAWIGKPNVASETLAPTTWAGSAAVPAADLSFDLGGDGPVATAYATGELQIIHDIESRRADLDCAAQVHGEDVEAAIVIPLVYKETTYGVLTAFAAETGAFDEREQVVLGALGRAVANAINAVERGRIMDAAEIIELEFTVDDSDLLFCRLSRGANCRVEVSGTDYRPDGSLRLYLTGEGANAERLVALAREDTQVREASVIADHEDSCLLEVTVEESILDTLSEYGAVTREVVGEEGTARFTVELPYEAEAREVFELVEGRYPNTDLVGYHERERPVETRQEFRAALSERFTDRQETALRTAFLGGFFEWPRGIDGNELAESMDISRPTYHQHLRAAQRKVLEELFE